MTIAGKTGTAEKVLKGIPGDKSDQSWWCGYGPAARASAQASWSAR